VFYLAVLLLASSSIVAFSETTTKTYTNPITFWGIDYPADYVLEELNPLECISISSTRYPVSIRVITVLVSSPETIDEFEEKYVKDVKNEWAKHGNTIELRSIQDTTLKGVHAMDALFSGTDGKTKFEMRSIFGLRNELLEFAINLYCYDENRYVHANETFNKMLESFTFERIPEIKWEKYRDERNRYIISYPEDWKIGFDNADAAFPNNIKFSAPGSMTEILIQSSPNAQNASLIDYVKNEENWFRLTGVPIKKEETKVGIAKGYSLSWEKKDIKGTPLIQREHIVLVNDTLYYAMITTPKALDELYQRAYYTFILSNFRFV
jgi:hypothetical protein